MFEVLAEVKTAIFEIQQCSALVVVQSVVQFNSQENYPSHLLHSTMIALYAVHTPKWLWRWTWPATSLLQQPTRHESYIHPAEVAAVAIAAGDDVLVRLVPKAGGGHEHYILPNCVLEQVLRVTYLSVSQSK